MNALEFGQFIGAGLEKQSNKAKWLQNLIAPAAQSAAPVAQRAARSAVPATVTRAGTAAPSWLRHNQAVARGVDPKTGLRPGAVAPSPPPVPATPMPKTPGPITPNPATRKPLGPEGWGRVPTGPTPAAQAQSFYDNATSGGRQRMIGIDPQGRGVASAPQSWSQLAPEQQAAVQKFYSGGK